MTASIFVTPYGRLDPKPVAAAAIAYVADSADGAVLHLIGGETLRISNPVDEVEQLLGWRDGAAPKSKAKTSKGA